MIKTFFRWFIPFLKGIFTIKRNIDYKDIPIIINNFNRYDKLLLLISGLEARGYANIWIIDNDSTYPPLLEWYKTCPYKVVSLHANVGHLSLFKTGLYKMFWSSYYAYTDSDLEICDECPDDFMEQFVKLLKADPRVVKAGFSLRLDDLPDHYPNKAEVIGWESQFWKRAARTQNGATVYNAPVDTTFAVYKPWFKGGLVRFRDRHFRVGPPYVMRHLPWYIDPDEMSDEDEYYLKTIETSTHWSGQNKKQH